MSNLDKYEAVIGLEVHAQLSTKSKLFCEDGTAFGAAPNTQVSSISLAHPGTLPVMNEAVYDLAVRLGVALDCSITQHNYFARKNYFYPDLPKGYQVSQHTAPICQGGRLEIVTAAGKRSIKLNRIHIEEDAGKSIHDLEENYTCVDLNRAGMPLLEIVTEPALHSAEEAFEFVTNLRKILRWLGVCDGNMEEGSMRCDANVSVRPKGDKSLYTRVEVKNLNSIRNVKKAIEIEFERLVGLTEKGEYIRQETRSYDAVKNITFSLRSKEEAEDYRYFPEPDLPAFFISDEFIKASKESLPEMPMALEARLQEQYKLTAYDAAQLAVEKEDAAYFEELASKYEQYKSLANWLIGPVKQYCNLHNISLVEFPLLQTRLLELIKYTDAGAVSYQAASSILLDEMIAHADATPAGVAAQKNLVQEKNEDALDQWIEEALAEMPDKVADYKKGKKGLIGLFAGAVKKKSKGKADMKIVTALLEEKLK